MQWALADPASCCMPCPVSMLGRMLHTSQHTQGDDAPPSGGDPLGAQGSGPPAPGPSAGSMPQGSSGFADGAGGATAGHTAAGPARGAPRTASAPQPGASHASTTAACGQSHEQQEDPTDDELMCEAWREQISAQRMLQVLRLCDDDLGLLEPPTAFQPLTMTVYAAAFRPW